MAAASTDIVMKEEVEKIRKDLSKKATFLDAVDRLRTLFSIRFFGGSHEEKKLLFDAAKRVMTVLKTKFTAKLYYVGAVKLFLTGETCSGRVEGKLYNKELRELRKECVTFIEEIDGKSEESEAYADERQARSSQTSGILDFLSVLGDRAGDMNSADLVRDALRMMSMGGGSGANPLAGLSRGAGGENGEPITDERIREILAQSLQEDTQRAPPASKSYVEGLPRIRFADRKDRVKGSATCSLFADLVCPSKTLS
mmetsp:Transcript_10369/g.27169  ORF Transcript_10369/g.27169 Transcript_10369/m.27169 type:complete len:255 (-) Transcript_10369:19-783(-)